MATRRVPDHSRGAHRNFGPFGNRAGFRQVGGLYHFVPAVCDCSRSAPIIVPSARPVPHAPTPWCGRSPRQRCQGRVSASASAICRGQSARARSVPRPRPTMPQPLRRRGRARSDSICRVQAMAHAIPVQRHPQVLSARPSRRASPVPAAHLRYGRGADPDCGYRGPRRGSLCQ